MQNPNPAPTIQIQCFIPSYDFHFTQRLPWKMLNVIINCSTLVTNTVIKLPKKYIEPPKTPTLRIENFLNSVFVNSPAKLSAQKKQLVIIVTALVSSPRLVKKSLNNNPKDGMLPNANVC